MALKDKLFSPTYETLTTTNELPKKTKTKFYIPFFTGTDLQKASAMIFSRIKEAPKTVFGRDAFNELKPFWEGFFTVEILKKDTDLNNNLNGTVIFPPQNMPLLAEPEAFVKITSVTMVDDWGQSEQPYLPFRFYFNLSSQPYDPTKFKKPGSKSIGKIDQDCVFEDSHITIMEAFSLTLDFLWKEQKTVKEFKTKAEMLGFEISSDFLFLLKKKAAKSKRIESIEDILF